MIKTKIKTYKEKIKNKLKDKKDKFKNRLNSYKEGIKTNLLFYKKELKNSFNDIKHIKTFYKQIPNILTFIRLIGAIPAGLMFYFGNPYIALGLIAFLWGTDAIDGPIARKYKIESKLGADMDAIADKAMFLGSAIPLLTSSPILLLNFVLEGVISAINVTGRAKGLDTKTVTSGKKKTIALSLTLIAGYLVQFLGLPALIVNVLMGLTAAFQLVAIKDYLKEFKKMNQEQIEEKNKREELTLEKDESEEKTLTKEKQPAKSEQLKNLKKFILTLKEPAKKDKPKKRVRKKNK